ncbi:hypothetical protein THARTR1_04312 [Trichoderma harzianum]|uniref:NWD NACHT-NTPase N-terminal domain-containing protein n=1 Tax=Trichoderma harzianum TaxID=5544 RepID=A0A2K0UCI1_TRIHA|nr:hypothetical protein THARTR1_04312 [Trichoderma harzianum]
MFGCLVCISRRLPVLFELESTSLDKNHYIKTKHYLSFMRKLRRILGGKGSSPKVGSVASKADASSTSNGNGKPSPVEVAKAPVGPSESIWNSAYDALKADEPKLVQAYEKVLSLKLSQTAATPEPEPANAVNAIENEDVLVRRAQMHQLIDNGLNKTFREASFKNNISPVMQVVNTTKKLVSDAIKDMPQAALPWVLVS